MQTSDDENDKLGTVLCILSQQAEELSQLREELRQQRCPSAPTKESIKNYSECLQYILRNIPEINACDNLREDITKMIQILSIIGTGCVGEFMNATDDELEVLRFSKMYQRPREQKLPSYYNRNYKGYGYYPRNKPSSYTVSFEQPPLCETLASIALSNNTPFKIASPRFESRL